MTTRACPDGHKQAEPKSENETSNKTVCLALEMAALPTTSNTEQQDARNISLLSLSLHTYHIYKQKRAQRKVENEAKLNRAIGTQNNCPGGHG